MAGVTFRSNHPGDYVCVVTVIAKSIAILVQNGHKIPVSPLSTEYKTVIQAAEQFAAEKNIFFNRDIKTFTDPFLAVQREGNFWQPAELFANKVVIINNISIDGCNYRFNLDQDTAIKIAETIANNRNLTFLNVAL